MQKKQEPGHLVGTLTAPVPIDPAPVLSFFLSRFFLRDRSYITSNSCYTEGSPSLKKLCGEKTMRKTLCENKTMRGKKPLRGGKKTV